MSRKPQSEALKEKQVIRLRKEMRRTLSEVSFKRSILKQIVDGKSIEQIAAKEGMSIPAIRKRAKEITAEYHDNFSLEVAFWVEVLMARYNRLFEILWPLAENKEAGAIKFILEILEAQTTLLGASGADRQRKEALEKLNPKVDGELVVSVQTRYKNYLDAIKPPGVEYEVEAAEEVPLLPEPEAAPEESAEPSAPQEPSLLELYRDDDAL